MKHLLVIEDDPGIGNSLKVNLELEGFQVTWGKSFSEAATLFKKDSHNLMILDLGLPDGSGLDLCRRIRSEGSKIPIIILTAQTDEDSVVAGFEAGANDYVKKPFSNKELIARVKAMLRESPTVEDELSLGNLRVNIGKRRAFVNDEELSLNRREFDLLQILISRPDVVVTRESVIIQLSSAEEIFDRTIDSHISHLRAKLKKIPECNVKIKSEYGIGYRMVVIG